MIDDSAKTLADLSKLLNSAEYAIPNTFEYPGYIDIRYRGNSVTVGTECDTMTVQIACDDGTGLPVDDHDTIDLNAYSSMNELVPTLKNILASAYKTVDRVLF